MVCRECPYCGGSPSWCCRVGRGAVGEEYGGEWSGVAPWGPAQVLASVRPIVWTMKRAGRHPVAARAGSVPGRFAHYRSDRGNVRQGGPARVTVRHTAPNSPAAVPHAPSRSGCPDAGNHQRPASRARARTERAGGVIHNDCPCTPDRPADRYGGDIGSASRSQAAMPTVSTAMLVRESAAGGACGRARLQ